MNFELNTEINRGGAVAIVTGANTGLGFETSLALAKTGMTVVMACRNTSKAEAAKATLLAQQADAKLDVMALDLCDLASVRAFAEAFKAHYGRLDILVNNAGIMIPPYRQTVDGFESQFAANYLGHFLLSSLLFPLLPNTRESRIVSLSSLAHIRKPLQFDDINWRSHYDKNDAYCQSKLACLMFSDELQRRLSAQGSAVRAVCVHPGVSPTDLFQNLPGWLMSLLKATVFKLITHAPDKGAMPSIVAALGNNIRGGEYLGPVGFKEMKGPVGLAKRAPFASDAAAAGKLWEISEELVGQRFF